MRPNFAILAALAFAGRDANPLPTKKLVEPLIDFSDPGPTPSARAPSRLPAETRKRRPRAPLPHTTPHPVHLPGYTESDKRAIAAAERKRAMRAAKRGSQ